MKAIPFLFGFLGSVFLLSLFVAIVSLVGGFQEVISQLSDYGFYIVILVIGFGVQVGLYTHIKRSGKAVAVTGSTSGLAMISCCSHYLVSLLPALGATTLSGFISAYQTEIFLVGILMNLFGILYLIREINK